MRRLGLDARAGLPSVVGETRPLDWAAVRELAIASEDGVAAGGCAEAEHRLELLAHARVELDRMERIAQAEHLACCILPHVQVADQLAVGLQHLAAHRVGALIAIEQSESLDDYIARGTPLDAQLTPDLLESLFHPGSRLHDGAAIVRGNRVMAAGVFFPVTGERRRPSRGRLLGSRHRAALGMSRLSDAVLFVVSEETGQVSVALHGQLHTLAQPDLLLAPSALPPSDRSWRGRLRRWLGSSRRS